MATTWHALAGEVTVLAETVGTQLRRACRFVASVRDPRARALRRRWRARRAVLARSAVAAVSGAATAVVGEIPTLELTEIAGGSVTALAALGAGAAGARLVRLHRTPLPAATAPPAPPLPPPGSAAREPLQRLAAAEATLAELLALLARPRPGGPLLPEGSIRPVRDVADRAITSLRGTADAVLAVERAATSAPARERETLLQAVEGLAKQLVAGTDQLGALVAAAGRAVAAGGAEAAPADLTDATDRLAGLAAALDELADPGNTSRPGCSAGARHNG